MYVPPRNAGKLLAVTAYNPGSITTYTTSSATDADADATNLAVTFTVPGSGNVLVRFTAEADISTNTKNHLWTVREGSSTIAGPAVATNSTGPVSVSRPFLITGLTPGSSKTYKWGFKLDSTAANAHFYVGGVQGAGLMEVFAA